MHVARAAPIPVPVQIRMPRLYSFDVFETPASWSTMSSCPTGGHFTTDLQLSRPYVRWGIVDKALSKVTYRSDENHSAEASLRKSYPEHRKPCSDTWSVGPHYLSFRTMVYWGRYVRRLTR